MQLMTITIIESVLESWNLVDISGIIQQYQAHWLKTGLNSLIKSKSQSGPSPHYFFNGFQPLISRLTLAKLPPLMPTQHKINKNKHS